MEPGRDGMVLQEAMRIAARIRELRDEAANASLPEHPRPTAAAIAEQYPYRTDFLNSWSPQYVKPQGMWQRDQRRANIIDGVEEALRGVPTDLRQDVKGRLGWSGMDTSQLRSDTFSAGMAPPWSGASRMGAVMAPFQALMSAGQMATDQVLGAIGEPAQSPEAAAQFSNAVDGLTYPLTAYVGRRPAHLRAYDDYLAAERARPLYDVSREDYRPSPELTTVDETDLLQRAFPDASPWTHVLGGLVLGTATDPFVPYAGKAIRQLPRAFAEDVGGGAAFVAPFVAGSMLAPDGAQQRQNQAITSELLRQYTSP
jgi:hypothetical protein